MADAGDQVRPLANTNFAGGAERFFDRLIAAAGNEATRVRLRACRDRVIQQREEQSDAIDNVEDAELFQKTGGQTTVQQRAANITRRINQLPNAKNREQKQEQVLGELRRLKEQVEATRTLVANQGTTEDATLAVDTLIKSIANEALRQFLQNANVATGDAALLQLIRDVQQNQRQAFRGRLPCQLRTIVSDLWNEVDENADPRFRDTLQFLANKVLVQEEENKRNRVVPPPVLRADTLEEDVCENQFRVKSTTPLSSDDAPAPPAPPVPPAAPPAQEPAPPAPPVPPAAPPAQEPAQEPAEEPAEEPDVGIDFSDDNDNNNAPAPAAPVVAHLAQGPAAQAPPGMRTRARGRMNENLTALVDRMNKLGEEVKRLRLARAPTTHRLRALVAQVLASVTAIVDILENAGIQPVEEFVSMTFAEAIEAVREGVRLPDALGVFYGTENVLSMMANQLLPVDGDARAQIAAVCTLLEQRTSQRFGCSQTLLMDPGGPDAPIENDTVNLGPPRSAYVPRARTRGEAGPGLAAEIARIKQRWLRFAVPTSSRTPTQEQLRAQMDALALQTGVRVVRLFSPEFEQLQLSSQDLYQLCVARDTQRIQRNIRPSVADSLLTQEVDPASLSSRFRRSNPQPYIEEDWGYVLLDNNVPLGILYAFVAENAFDVVTTPDPAVGGHRITNFRVPLPRLDDEFVSVVRVARSLHIEFLCARHGSSRATQTDLASFLYTWALVDTMDDDFYHVWGTVPRERTVRQQGLSAGSVDTYLAAFYHVRFKWQRSFDYNSLNLEQVEGVVFRQDAGALHYQPYTAPAPSGGGSFWMGRPYPSGAQVAAFVQQLEQELAQNE